MTTYIYLVIYPCTGEGHKTCKLWAQGDWWLIRFREASHWCISFSPEVFSGCSCISFLWWRITCYLNFQKHLILSSLSLDSRATCSVFATNQTKQTNPNQSTCAPVRSLFLSLWTGHFSIAHCTRSWGWKGPNKSFNLLVHDTMPSLQHSLRESGGHIPCLSSAKGRQFLHFSFLESSSLVLHQNLSLQFWLLVRVISFFETSQMCLHFSLWISSKKHKRNSYIHKNSPVSHSSSQSLMSRIPSGRHMVSA